MPTRIRLSRFLAQHAGQRLDLDVNFHRGPRVVGFRVVVLPGREATMTRLCTNLPRTPFSLDLIARLYRFRWQIEFCFKEWTSYATLHQCDTPNVGYRLLPYNSHGPSCSAAAETFAGFRLFARVFGSYPHHDTRAVTRREHLPSFLV